MRIPDYWLERPDIDIDDKIKISFDDLLRTTLAPGGNPSIQYNLPAPKWQFLCHLAEHHELALHGSGNDQIALFEPRQSNDLNPFGNRKAVYAAADGIWAMFFAITDRDQFQMTVTNACIRPVDQDGKTSGPFYFFSVSKLALSHKPWRTGTVYILPSGTFEAHPPIPFGESNVHVAQLASLVPVQPLARLTVAPGDFPFLSEIRGHDDRRIQETATALQTGGPLPEDN